MVRTMLAVLLAGIGSGALAQSAPGAAPTAPQPRAPGPPLVLAVEAAQTAMATCLANGYKTTVLVTDSAGIPVVMLSADGAGARLQQIGPTKIATVLKFGVPSGDVADRAKNDPKLAAEIAADPAIGMARRGGLAIQAGARTIGYMAVAGAPGGEKDEVCVKAGLERIADRLK